MNEPIVPKLPMLPTLPLRDRLPLCSSHSLKPSTLALLDASMGTIVDKLTLLADNAVLYEMPQLIEAISLHCLRNALIGHLMSFDQLLNVMKKAPYLHQPAAASPSDSLNAARSPSLSSSTTPHHHQCRAAVTSNGLISSIPSIC